MAIARCVAEMPAKRCTSPGRISPDKITMPAINLTHLRARFNLLLQQINEPEVFIHGLREVYAFHADLTHPAGDSPTGVFTLPAFNTPLLLTSEVIKLLSPFCNERPQLMLRIIDLLWQEAEIELRELAAELLGKLPQEQFHEVIHRIQKWSLVESDAELLPYLHQHASAAIRSEAADLWLEVLDGWNSASEPWLAKLALDGTLPLIDDPAFDNLPAIFTFISPLILNPEAENQYEVLRVINHLARRSEVETVYFLKQVMSLSTAPGMGRFLRRAVELFSPPMQQSLRAAMRERQLT